MSDDMRLSTFPGNAVEALTMLYLKNQDLSDVTPEELADKFTEAQKRISDRLREIRNAKVKTWKL